MAVGTLAGDLVGMRILAGVAARAILGQLLGGIRNMAGMAVQFRVRTDQGKFVPLQMIVFRQMPAIVAVAGFAFHAEAMRVRIVGAMAAVAVLWDFFLVIAAPVTRQAIDFDVDAEQGVARLLEVIVFGGFPFLGGMTLAAVGSTRAAMLVVRGVTTDACLG